MESSGYKGPINPNPADGESSVIIYGYVPSRALATIALVSFGLVALNYLSILARFKQSRAFSGLMVFGCICEIVGYAARLFSHYHPYVVVYFIIQYFFIVVSPVFFQAAFYLALGLGLRRLDHRGSTLLRFEPKILIAVMIVSDVVTTIIQVVGAALIGVAESARFGNGSASITSDQANDILLAGLATQTASFLAFLVLLGLCIWRSARTFTAAHLPKQFSLLLFLASLLVFLRTTFRLAETAQGVFGYASSHEALFGTLEYLPVILAVSIYAAIPLEHQLPIDVDDERYEPSVDDRSLDMRQTTKEARTIDLRSGGGGGPGGADLEPEDGYAGEADRRSRDGKRGGYAAREDDDGALSSPSGSGSGTDSSRTRTRTRSRDEVEQRDEDEGVVSDESPRTAVERGAGSGSDAESEKRRLKRE
ncbi:hypothetical protein JCM3775_000765 [Rhodotorula graminis]|uniref:Uncharacterized protein n=1 Tax=Rhodotorula graminis (strain WP1) TaxID=578459 RepID=A0A194SAV8_RHOGW|nr:uncharacterized protein RHOBADRAFT_41857 [Rhodotorula graminis WP1]KPV77858.1 hypothetical protein RHOBADRAFT_41857 [Rhodotorula graminis WP1]